jgi:hypothetical protein
MKPHYHPATMHRQVGRWAGGIAFGALLINATIAYAHHSVLPYDGTTPTTITGTVVKVLWQNPHAYIDLDVAANGTNTRWIVENEGPVALERLGWTKTALMPRDVITITGARARDGSTRMRCAVVTLADARRLPCFPSGGF